MDLQIDVYKICFKQTAVKVPGPCQLGFDFGGETRVVGGERRPGAWDQTRIPDYAHGAWGQTLILDYGPGRRAELQSGFLTRGLGSDQKAGLWAMGLGPDPNPGLWAQTCVCTMQIKP